MIVLPDSSVWIAYFRSERSQAANRLDRLIMADADVCLCGPVLSEVLCGLTRPAESRRVKVILDQLRFLSADRHTHEHAAEICLRCRAGGFTIRSIVDCIIAATALKHDAEILHHDRDYTAIAKIVPLKVH